MLVDSVYPHMTRSTTVYWRNYMMIVVQREEKVGSRKGLVCEESVSPLQT